MRVGVLNGNFVTWLKVNFRASYFLLGLNLVLGALTAIFTYSFFRGNDTLTLVFFGGQILPGSDPAFSYMAFEYWRFLTAAFLHGSLIHLLFNMYALNAVGGFIERYWGGSKLFLVYVITAVTGSLLSFGGAILDMWRNQASPAGLVVSVGASGAIFGLIGLILGNRFLRRNTFDPEFTINYNDLIFIVIVNLVLGFGINMLGAGVAINNWAHIGGLVGGLILGAFLDTKNTFDRSRAKKVFENVLFFLAVAIFIVAWLFNFISMISLAGGILR